MNAPDRELATDALADEYAVLGEIIGSLTPIEMVEASGCRGWTNEDLVYHMLRDAQRALVALNTPGPGSPDKNFVDYWKDWDASTEDSQAQARFVRLSAAAHSNGRQICSRWLLTAPAVIRMCRSSEPAYVSTQGHVLAVGDFIATLVVEVAIHHLDLIRNLEARRGPAETAVSLTAATLDGLLQGPRPPRWDDNTYLLKATGREALDDEDRSVLGAAADRFPLFS